MPDLELKWPRRAARWRTSASVASALLIHALVLGHIALRGLSGGESTRPLISDPRYRVVDVWLAPRPVGSEPMGRVRDRSAAVPPAAGSSLGGASREPSSLDEARATSSRQSRLAPAPGSAKPPVPGTSGTGHTPPSDARPTLRRGLNCGVPSLAPGTVPDQAVCDQRFGAAAARARPVGEARLTAAEARREVRFARDGAAALGAFEERERPLAPNARARGCPAGPSPREECEVSISGRIWSSRDGWFPDLPRPR